MAIRIRKNGQIFCAAHSKEEEGDLYLDDSIHEILGGCLDGRPEKTYACLVYDLNTHEYKRGVKEFKGMSKNHTNFALEVSEKIMRNILHDIGAVSRVEKEYISTEWRERIAGKVLDLYRNNDDLPDIDQMAEDLSCGEESEVEEKYEFYNGFSELKETIDSYFNQI